MRHMTFALAAAITLLFTVNANAQTYASLDVRPFSRVNRGMTATIGYTVNPFMDIRMTADKSFDFPDFTLAPGLRLKLPLMQDARTYAYLDLEGRYTTTDLGGTFGYGASAGLVFFFTERLGFDIELCEAHRNINGPQDPPTPKTYYYSWGLLPIGTTSIGLIFKF